MLILDTCVLIFDALTPERLSQAARQAIVEGETRNALYCSDISLWEIAMLVDRKRLDPGTDTITFLRLVQAARALQVLPIVAEVAHLAATLPLHGDPADRIIAATAVYHGARLVTSDQRLRDSTVVPTLW